MVEYWKKVRGESKTDDANPTGCRAYETLLDTSLALNQYRTARCRSRVSTVCLPWDTDYQGSLEIGDRGEGGGDKSKLKRNRAEKICQVEEGVPSVCSWWHTLVQAVVAHPLPLRSFEAPLKYVVHQGLRRSAGYHIHRWTIHMWCWCQGSEYCVPVTSCSHAMLHWLIVEYCCYCCYYHTPPAKAALLWLLGGSVVHR